MTIGNWSYFDNLASMHGFVYPLNNSDDLPDDVDTYKGISVIANDIMVELRKMHPREFVDERGVFHRETVQKTFFNFFNYILHILDKTEVMQYVICMDPLYNARPEKRATAKKRVYLPKNEPAVLDLPVGQAKYFKKRAPFPAPNVNIIFRTPQAKREFYHAVTKYLSSSDYARFIPEGKHVILCGGYNRHTERNYSPIFINNQGHHIADDLAFPSCSEGDLYAIWAVRHFPGNFMVKSGDADLLFILVLAMQNILKIDPTRKCWFVTPRCAGTVEHDLVGQELKLLMHKNQAFLEASAAGTSEKDLFVSLGSLPSIKSLSVKRPRTDEPSSSSSSSLVIAKRQWLRRYVDMVGFYNAVHDEATSHLTHNGFQIFSPIENMVACFLLASKSHDYIDLMNFAKGVGDGIIFKAAMAHQRELAGLVKVGYGDDRITGAQTKYITVDAQLLREFLIMCYRTASKTKANSEKAFNNFMSKIPPLEVTQTIAGQLAWTLHYWSLGCIRSARIESGLILHPESGKPLYGFEEDGWTLKLDNKIWTTNIHLSHQITCPLFSEH